MAARTSIRVRGVTYSSPDEAYVAAAELEDNAESVAGNLRRDGHDAEAEQVSDRARADAERLRAFAREREEHAAAATAQPPDAPPPSPSPSSSSSSPGAGRGARKRASTRRGSSASSGSRRRTSSSRRAFTPRTRSIVVGTGIPRATSSATSLALQVVGLTIGVAFLTLLLTDRGVSAFGDLTGGVANGLRWLLDPVDPLAPRKSATGDFAPGAKSSGGGGNFASATATGNARTAPAARAVTFAPLAVGVG